jgi:hypothetical protein
MISPKGFYYIFEEYIEVTLEICTLYKGVPHGPAIILYIDE